MSAILTLTRTTRWGSGLPDPRGDGGSPPLPRAGGAYPYLALQGVWLHLLVPGVNRFQVSAWKPINEETLKAYLERFLREMELLFRLAEDLRLEERRRALGSPELWDGY